MTQPAKVQEPSMEEILASIRRIIADDEAKPPAAEAAAPPAEKPPVAEKKSAAPPPAAAKPAAPAAKPPVMNDIPPSAIAPAKPAPPPAAPAPLVSNSQDDIDALLNGLDEATTPEEIRPPLPDGEVFELTDDMAVAPPEPPQPAFHKIEPHDDIEFTETAAARALHRQPVFEPPPLESSSPAQPILSRSTVSAVESAFNTPGPYRTQQQCADPGRPGQGNAAADAEVVARRQSARAGGAHRQGGNRAGFARPPIGRPPRGFNGQASAITSGFMRAFAGPSC